MGRIRVLMVDDQTLFRNGIRALLEACDDIEVVGEAADGREALEKVDQLKPDIVLMDIAMPAMGGLEATPRIQEEHASVRVLALSEYEDRGYILQSMKAGACGWVSKRAPASELISAIRAVCRGDLFFPPSVVKILVQEVQRLGGAKEDEYERLSGREREVLQLMAEGHTSKEIARLLALGEKTVWGLRARVQKKLGIHNRTELVKYAARRGLVRI